MKYELWDLVSGNMIATSDSADDLFNEILELIYANEDNGGIDLGVGRYTDEGYKHFFDVQTGIYRKVRTR
jgi:hypothetical protein